MEHPDDLTRGVAQKPHAEAGSEPRLPRLYRVFLHNDHFTTMEFVVGILVAVFHKPPREAQRIMLEVHRRGRGACGVFSYDIARSKVARVLELAREKEFPLRCTFEEA